MIINYKNINIKKKVILFRLENNLKKYFHKHIIDFEIMSVV